MIEELVQKLTEHLYSGSKEFYYKGHRFEIEEYIYSNPIEFNSYTRISIKVPVYLNRTFQGIYSTMYENRPGLEKTERFLRIEACARLANEFVTVALPKIDYELKKELHYQKLEEVLDVLEG